MPDDPKFPVSIIDDITLYKMGCGSGLMCDLCEARSTRKERRTPKQQWLVDNNPE